MPGAPGGPGSLGPRPRVAGGATGTGAWVGAFLSAVAFGRFSMVIGQSAHTGPLMPPSFRIRQKWMTMKMAVMSGKAMTWKT